MRVSMSELKFSKLYGEEPRAGSGGTLLPGKAKPLFALFRLPVGIGLLIFGFFLFSLQMLSGSDNASPGNLFALVLVEDLQELRDARQESESPPEENDKSSASDQSEGEKQRPNTMAHYQGKPSQSFQERFEEFVSELKAPEGLLAVPANLLLRKSSYIVEAGGEPDADSSALGDPDYLLMSITLDNAPVVLGPMIGFDSDLSGKHFIGPNLFRKTDGPLEIILPDKQRASLTRLPDDATAMQALIIRPVEDLQPNCLMLIPLGDITTGDFASKTSAFTRSIKESNNLGPVFHFSDYRHNSLVFAFAVIGEVLFLVGGFLLFYHLFARIAGRERKDGANFANAFIDSCRLIVRNYQAYALVIGLFLLFWLWGVISAALDPGYQKMVVQWYRSQFAGGSWPLGVAGQAYASGNILLAIIVTFLINFVQGTVIMLSLLSVIPVGAAFIVNALRGQILGLALAPTDLFFGQSLSLHLPTILIELQGYLLAAFVSVLLPLSLLYPRNFGCEKRFDAFKKFALWQFRMLPLIAVILLVAAIYEAVELIMLRGL